MGCHWSAETATLRKSRSCSTCWQGNTSSCKRQTSAVRQSAPKFIGFCTRLAQSFSEWRASDGMEVLNGRSAECRSNQVYLIARFHPLHPLHLPHLPHPLHYLTHSTHHSYRNHPPQAPKYSGSLPGVHLMLQPMLGFWSELKDFPARTVSMAARRSLPVTGTSLPGRLSSSCPR